MFEYLYLKKEQKYFDEILNNIKKSKPLDQIQLKILYKLIENNLILLNNDKILLFTELFKNKIPKKDFEPYKKKLSSKFPFIVMKFCQQFVEYFGGNPDNFKDLPEEVREIVRDGSLIKAIENSQGIIPDFYIEHLEKFKTKE